MECMQDRLQQNFEIIFNIVCEYLHLHYGMEKNLSLSEVEDFIEAIIKKLIALNTFPKLEFKFSVENYWLDASESIYVKYLILNYGDDEIYKVSTDEFANYHGLTFLIQILLYCYEMIIVKKHIKEFLNYNCLEKL